MTPIDRKWVCRKLHELSSIDEQCRLWMSDGANNAEVSSFEEAWEQLYTDSALSKRLPNGYTGFSPEVNGLLVELDKMLSQVDYDRYSQEIINDPCMESIRKKAGEILAMLCNE